MPDVHHGFCNFCDAMCGLAIEIEGDRILSIRGDKQNPFSKGYVCPKGIAQQDVHNDPDRLRKPIRRRGKDWEEIGWEEAIDEVGEQVAALQKKHGNDSLAVYFGNPISHNYASLLQLVPFVRGFRTKNVYSSGSVDSFSRMLVSQLMYGSPAALPVPDLGRTNYFLIIGANPAVSNGSIMTAPDCKRRMRELRERGGKLVVIDPRRTETADMADEHHFIRPAADALFLVAFLQVFFAEGLSRPHRFPVPVDGLDDVRKFVADFPPERVAPHVGIEPNTIRRLARDFARADGAACYGRMGTSVQSFGALATWLIDVINLVSGNMDQVGGTMFSKPAVDLVALAKIVGQTGSFGAYRSRVKGLRELNGEFPVAALYDEIVTAGPGQVKGLVTISGNPVLALPNGGRLDALFANLEFMASIDIYLNETTRHAHLILPPTSTLETDHYPLLEAAMAVQNTAQYAPAPFQKKAGTLHDWEIMVKLAGAYGRARGGIAHVTGILHETLGQTLTPPRLLELMLRTGPYKLSLAELKEHPHGIDLGPLAPRMKDVMSTKTGRIDMAPREIREDFARLKATVDAPACHRDDFLLIGRRTLRSMNSWLHNSKRLVTGKSPCVLFMHPDDTRRLGLRDGERVHVTSNRSRVELPLEVTDEVMPGVVCMPYGWGHNREGIRMGVAEKAAGANYNDLVDEEAFDPVSGASVLNGVSVRVTAVAAGS
jgi:anaerobic selenocysteine-containing dehydrogenase